MLLPARKQIQPAALSVVLCTVPCCRYGKQAVPLDKVAEDVLAYKPARSMQLVGFMAAGQAMRALQLRSSYLVLPDPDDEQHAHALAVLVRAMINKNRHAGAGHVAQHSASMMAACQHVWCAALC